MYNYYSYPRCDCPAHFCQPVVMAPVESDPDWDAADGIEEAQQSLQSLQLRPSSDDAADDARGDEAADDARGVEAADDTEAAAAADAHGPEAVPARQEPALPAAPAVEAPAAGAPHGMDVDQQHVQPTASPAAVKEEIIENAASALAAAPAVQAPAVQEHHRMDVDQPVGPNYAKELQEMKAYMQKLELQAESQKVNEKELQTELQRVKAELLITGASARDGSFDARRAGGHDGGLDGGSDGASARDSGRDGASARARGRNSGRDGASARHGGRWPTGPDWRQKEDLPGEATGTTFPDGDYLEEWKCSHCQRTWKRSHGADYLGREALNYFQETMFVKGTCIEPDDFKKPFPWTQKHKPDFLWDELHKLGQSFQSRSLFVSNAQEGELYTYDWLMKTLSEAIFKPGNGDPETQRGWMLIHYKPKKPYILIGCAWCHRQIQLDYPDKDLTRTAKDLKACPLWKDFRFCFTRGEVRGPPGLEDVGGDGGGRGGGHEGDRRGGGRGLRDRGGRGGSRGRGRGESSGGEWQQGGTSSSNGKWQQGGASYSNGQWQQGGASSSNGKWWGQDGGHQNKSWQPRVSQPTLKARDDFSDTGGHKRENSSDQHGHAQKYGRLDHHQQNYGRKDDHQRQYGRKDDYQRGGSRNDKYNTSPSPIPRRRRGQSYHQDDHGYHTDDSYHQDDPSEAFLEFKEFKEFKKFKEFKEWMVKSQ